MLRHMYDLATNDPNKPLCRRPLGVVRQDWNNVNCADCLALREVDYKALFLDLYRQAAAIEPPDESQLAEVLDAFQSQFTAADADTAEDSEKMYLVCINCGEAFDEIKTALEHGPSDLSGSVGWCGDEGFNILPESEAF